MRCRLERWKFDGNRGRGEEVTAHDGIGTPPSRRCIDRKVTSYRLHAAVECNLPNVATDPRGGAE